MTLKSTALLLAAASLLPLAARADSISGSGGGYSGSGTITATDQGGGQYLITGIAGANILGLYGEGGFNGNDNLLFPSGSPSIDNAGFSFLFAAGQDTDSVNIFFDGSGYEALVVDEGGNGQNVPVTFDVTTSASATPSTRAMSPAAGSPVANAPSTTQFDFSFLADSIPPSAPSTPEPATPEPSSLILLGTGIAGVAGAVRRRRRSA